jgi:hypothetical protein
MVFLNFKKKNQISLFRAQLFSDFTSLLITVGELTLDFIIRVLFVYIILYKLYYNILINTGSQFIL